MAEALSLTNSASCRRSFNLGDSVYAEFDGYHIVLTTDNGYGASNTIALESPVYFALRQYAKRIWGERA